MSKTEYYKSADMACVTALSLFFPITDISKTDPKKVEFCFVKTPDLVNFLDKYWRDEVSVSPIQYFNQIKTIKRRLYEAY